MSEHESRPASAPAQYAPSPQTNSYAIASLVIGIAVFGIGSPLALIFGYKARNEIDRSGGWQTGRGLAIAGIVLGWVGLAFMILFVAFVVLAFAVSTDSGADFGDVVHTARARS